MFHIVPSDPYIGKHIGKVKNFFTTISRLIEDGNETACQIFLRGNQRPFINISSFFDQNDVSETSILLQKHDIRCVIHAAYSYNLCSENPHILNSSINGIVNELDFAVALSGDNFNIPLVIHTGSNPDREAGISISVNAINKIVGKCGELTSIVSSMKNIWIIGN